MEVVVATLAEIPEFSREMPLAAAKIYGFEPDWVRLGVLEVIGASAFRENIRFDDYPATDCRSTLFSQFRLGANEGQTTRPNAAPGSALSLVPGDCSSGVVHTQFKAGVTHG
jgi:hypothetical protein